ncbi:MAG: LPS export ABC transporter periplasmic protein LptC [Candidatus Firestonebacteria bacterium]|nr:LPS export ABC transporter periplasmic protein LptC [Candidatus Firestonebacteria bacterium]
MRGFGLAVGLLVWFLVGCSPEPQPNINLAPAVGKVEEPNLMFEGFRMVSTRGAQREYDFIARAAQIFERDNMARAQDIKIIYWRQGKPASTLTARRGFVNTVTHDMRAEQQVVMVSQEGAVLRTERLHWDNLRGRIYTELPVTVERGTNVMTGVGLEADSELKHIEVLSRVNIRVRSLKELKSDLAAPAAGKRP